MVLYSFECIELLCEHLSLFPSLFSELAVQCGACEWPNTGVVWCRYIHQVVTPEVNAVAKELMKSLIAFQARHYQRDPVRARIKSV